MSSYWCQIQNLLSKILFTVLAPHDVQLSAAAVGFSELLGFSEILALSALLTVSDRLDGGGVRGFFGLGLGTGALPGKSS